MGEERSPGGAFIKRYGVGAAPNTAPPERPTYFNDILAHLEPLLGLVETVYDEIVSDQVYLEVFAFAPSRLRHYWTIVTCGMSTRPMAAPKGMDDPSSHERAEFVMCLPEDWFGPDPKNLEQLARDGKVWPIEILKFAARFVHLHDTWLLVWSYPDNCRPSRTVRSDHGILRSRFGSSASLAGKKVANDRA